MKKINTHHILLLHHILIEYSGGSDGIRDKSLLESAVNAPFATFGGVALCNTIQSKAAKLCFGLIKNHPFIDGNKRIGILAMLSFLEDNGIKLKCNDKELVTLGLKLAEGTINETDVLNFIINHN